MRTVEVTVERKRSKNYNTATARYTVGLELTDDDSATDLIDHWTATLKAKLAEAFPTTSKSTTDHAA